jgi:iron complex outermembrane recepter protein
MKSYLYIAFAIAGMLPVLVKSQNFKTADAVAVLPVKVAISGKVADVKTSLPLAGASIYFPDLKLGTTTNSEGYYKLQHISQGRHLIEISYTGYASIIESIDIVTDTEKNFELRTTYAEREAVTVTGVSSATSVKRASIPVSILKKEELLRGVSTNLIDALAKTPGVSQIGTGPAVSKPSIRGLGYNRVVVVNDGIRQEGQQWGDEHGIEIDEYSVSKAEILKGPASLMYGSDALAGVINIISLLPEAAATVKGNVFSTYQTNNRQRGLHATIGGNKNGYIWGGYASYKAAADYKNKYDGYVFNSKFYEKNVGFYTGLHKSWGYSHLYFTSFNQNLGLIEGERDAATGQFLKLINNNSNEEEVIATGNDFTSINPFTPHQKIKHTKLVSDNSFKLGSSRLTATLGYQRNKRKEFGNVLDLNETELFFDLATINYNIKLHLAEKNKWKTAIGVNGMQQTNTNKGAEALIPDYALFDAGIFVVTQKSIDKITFSAGARADNRTIAAKEYREGNDVKFEAFNKGFANVSASTGISYEVSKAVTLKANLARGFRAPSLPELASNGAHEGTNRYEYGNRQLKSETSWQSDAGIEMANEHVSFTANFFLNAINNFIYYSKLGAAAGGDSIVTDGGEDFFAFEYKQQNAKLYGVEFNFDIHPHPLDWLHVENTFSYVRGILKKPEDASKNLPFIPAPRLINRVKAVLLSKTKTIVNAYMQIEADNNFAQNNPFAGYNTETATPAFTLLNVGAGFTLQAKQKAVCSIYLTANNITDAAYQNHLSRLKYTAVNEVTQRAGVFNMGRNFSIKLLVPFNFTNATHQKP